MTSSFVISNREPATSTESKHKKRRKIDTNIIVKHNNQKPQNKSQTDGTKWKSATEHKMYASKLVDALRRRTSESTVRETADRVLALSAKGRTRWSRAIVSNRVRLQMKMIKHRNKTKSTRVGVAKRSKRLMRTPRLVAVQEKARDLSRLVPGCRKITFPNLLEEVSDYIAALEMQVRAMSALTGLLATPT